jgi:hypothetical protein
MVEANGSVEHSKECRICLEGEDISLGRLFSPCLCRGTQKYIHEGCLNKWRLVGNNRAFYKCPTCKYDYRISRVYYANLLFNEVTIGISTAITIILAVILGAFFIRNIIFLLIGIKLSRSVVAFSGQLIWWSVLTIGVITLLLTILTDHNHNNNLNFVGDMFFPGNRIYIDNYFFDFLGYTLSLTGFGIFIIKIYHNIKLFMYKQLNKFGERILEVN